MTCAYSPNMTKAAAQRRPVKIFSKMPAIYLVLIIIPFVLTLTMNLDTQSWYFSFLGGLNLIAMAAFFVQFPLIPRLKQIPLFQDKRWNLVQHKRAGKWIGFFFFLHPLLILAPRFMVSTGDGVNSLITTINSPQLLTGILAWAALVIWTLLAIFKNHAPLSANTWRITHWIGFIFIGVLATLHITTVGRHGQYAEAFNSFWWVLCGLSSGLVLGNQIWRKRHAHSSD